MKKNRFYISVLAAALLCVASCGHSAPTYDAGLCQKLAEQIDRRQQLTQEDYSSMIQQNIAILQYLIDKNKAVAATPEADRPDEWSRLVHDEDYMERFGYLFTIGSALYQADSDGLLDEANRKAYAEVDRYNSELARYHRR